MTKAQRQTLVDMLTGKQYLKRKGDAIWCFSHDRRTIRESTVLALMRDGLVTQGFESCTLTNEGRRVAIYGATKVQKRTAAAACA
jgi:hypothetical protein